MESFMDAPCSSRSQKESKKIAPNMFKWFKYGYFKNIVFHSMSVWHNNTWSQHGGFFDIDIFSCERNPFPENVTPEDILLW
jgi:hypothetical protein